MTNIPSPPNHPETQNTLKELLQKCPILSYNIASYSMDFKCFDEIQKKALDQLHSELKSNGDIATKILQENITLFVPNLYITLEGYLNFFAAIYNPISRYDYSYFHTHEEGETWMILEQAYFGASKLQNNKRKLDNVNTLRKLKLCFGFFFNNLRKLVSTDSAIQLNENISIYFEHKYEDFNIDNLYSSPVFQNIHILFKGKKISVQTIFQTIDFLTIFRDSLIHPQPFKIHDIIQGSHIKYNKVKSAEDRVALTSFKVAISAEYKFTENAFNPSHEKAFLQTIIDVFDRFQNSVDCIKQTLSSLPVELNDEMNVFTDNHLYFIYKSTSSATQGKKLEAYLREIKKLEFENEFASLLDVRYPLITNEKSI